jgi:hypothetical protein
MGTDMQAPSRFCVAERFKHHNPEYVRDLATRHGFEQRTQASGEKPEIWIKPNFSDSGPGPAGYWIIRLDMKGHGAWFHGRRPHYHKNWVDSLATLLLYLTEYTPQAFVYGDDGTLIGRADQSTHPEHKSKAQHIPR